MTRSYRPDVIYGRLPCRGRDLVKMQARHHVGYNTDRSIMMRHYMCVLPKGVVCGLVKSVVIISAYCDSGYNCAQRYSWGQLLVWPLEGLGFKYQELNVTTDLTYRRPSHHD